MVKNQTTKGGKMERQFIYYVTITVRRLHEGYKKVGVFKVDTLEEIGGLLDMCKTSTDLSYHLKVTIGEEE